MILQSLGCTIILHTVQSNQIKTVHTKFSRYSICFRFAAQNTVKLGIFWNLEVQNDSWVAWGFSVFLWLPTGHSQSLFVVIKPSETGGNFHKSTWTTMWHDILGQPVSSCVVFWVSGSWKGEHEGVRYRTLSYTGSWTPRPLEWLCRRQYCQGQRGGLALLAWG